MKNRYNNINTNPTEDGRYLVKFYNKDMPCYDATELVFREFQNGTWLNPIYNHENDGYVLVGWYDN